MVNCCFEHNYEIIPINNELYFYCLICQDKVKVNCTLF